MIKVAVIGGGHWGRNLVRNFVDLGTLVVVCDISYTTLLYYCGMELRNPADDVEPAYQGVVTSTLDNVLAFDEIRGVAIATPPEQHYTMAKKSLLAGKDVFVEKPMTLDVRQAKELVDIAEDNGRILMVGHLMQYHPGFVKLQELDIGFVKYIHSTRCRPKDTSTDNVVWGLGPHDVSMMLRLMGSPKRVSCQMTNNNAIIDMGYGHIFLSYDYAFKKSEFVVVGDKTVVLNDKLTLHYRGEEKDIPFSDREPLKIELQHFLHCVDTRERPLTGGNEGLEVVRILAACE